MPEMLFADIFSQSTTELNAGEMLLLWKILLRITTLFYMQPDHFNLSNIWFIQLYANICRNVFEHFYKKVHANPKESQRACVNERRAVRMPVASIW